MQGSLNKLPQLFSATLLFSLSILMNVAHATDWKTIQEKAKGQTVYFNAWGGSENINAYIDWAAEQVKQRSGITVKHVKTTDTAAVVKRIQTEIDAGKTSGGSVDLVWVNGENFSKLKQSNLLFGPWAESIPNWELVDTEKPVQQDFSESTDGLEAPWGTAQLTFIANKNTLTQPPKSALELLELAKKNPGRLSYPKPPDFHGTTFLKQLLSDLSTDTKLLQEVATDDNFAEATKPLWSYLDELHPYTWRKGAAFPSNIQEMHQKLADGELLMSLTFNPNEGTNLVASGALPKSAYSFGFENGTIGNVHFLAISANSSAKEGSQVFVNFLLSPEAQARKGDINVWGDPTILALDKLSKSQQKTIQQQAIGGLKEVVPTLKEPHASWVDKLEKEWLKRYGS